VFDFVRLHRWLARLGIKVSGFKEKDGKITFEPGYHASGHASADELVKIVERIAPELVIPVHTSRPKFFTEMDRKVAVPVQGIPITIQ
jgi:ribonuclease J